MTRRVGFAAVLVVVAALAGCATPVTGEAGPGAADPGAANPGAADLAVDGGPSGEPCDTDVPYPPEYSHPPEETLTDGAHLTLATRCVFTTEVVPGDGEWSVRLNQQATDGLDALAAALRRPSAAAPAPGQVCPAIGYLPIIITVTEDTGRSLHPAIPHEACGRPLKAVTDAIAALTWTTTARSRMGQVRTELEVTSGCSGAWKPVIAMLGVEASSRQNRYPVDTDPGELSVCRYDSGSEEMVLNGGVTLHIAVLTGASTLPPDAAHELLAAVDAAPPAAGCDAQESPFAVISGARTSLTVELAGCYRASVDVDSDLRQLDAALVTRLFG